MRRKKHRHLAGEGSYVCPSCGEPIEIPIDRSSGDEQEYVEDCPVCCRPNVIHVEFFVDNDPPRVWAEPERRLDERATPSRHSFRRAI